MRKDTNLTDHAIRICWYAAIKKFLLFTLSSLAGQQHVLIDLHKNFVSGSHDQDLVNKKSPLHLEMLCCLGTPAETAAEFPRLNALPRKVYWETRELYLSSLSLIIGSDIALICRRNFTLQALFGHFSTTTRTFCTVSEGQPTERSMHKCSR